MGFEWIAEKPAVWDEPKAAIVGCAPDGIFDLGKPQAGDLLPGEWWRVEENGEVLGYGWMDFAWSDAEILLVVSEPGRRRGVGTFILDSLEREASTHGLNYMFNVVLPTHPDRAGITGWLKARRFEPAHDDERLIRRVHPAEPRPK